jgi:hypothetical protein
MIKGYAYHVRPNYCEKHTNLLIDSNQLGKTTVITLDFQQLRN